MAIPLLKPQPDEMDYLPSDGAAPNELAQTSGPLPTIAPQPQPANMLPTIKEPASQFQPNASRQQREESLRGDISKYDNPEKPHGFWGKTGHVLSTIGNIAGDIFAPSTMMLIPGTQMHSAMEQRGRVRELGQLENQDRADETAFNQGQNEQSESRLRDSQGREAEARADALENPQPTFQHLETDQGIFAFDPKTRQLVPLTFNGQPLMPKQPAPKELSAENDLKNQILAAEQKGDMPTVKKLQQQLKDLNPQAEQRFSFQIGSAGDKQDTAQKAQVFKVYQPVMDSAERFNVMADAYEKAIKDHDQQAMLNLLYNHMGMTMGLQKGARMTQDLIREAQQSQPWLQGIKAKFDNQGYLSGVTLSPQQMRQMVGLAQNRFGEDAKKAGGEARFLGYQGPGPARDASDAVQRYYLNAAGRDPAKARQLMQADGWTF